MQISKGVTLDDFIHIMVIPQYCIAHSYCARFSRHLRALISAFTYTRKEISLKLSEINVRFLLNEHGDVYFLLPNNSVHIILLNVKENYNFLSEGKNDVGKRVYETVTL